MTNKIEQFLNDKFGEVRASMEDGNLLFVASDVAKALSYASTQKVTEKVDDEDKGQRTWLTLGGEQKMVVINESGLYQVLASITKRDKKRYEMSREFKRWITGEVIPTIRQTGGYVEDKREDEFVNKYFPSFSEEVKLAMINDLMKTNKELTVKASKFDQFLDVDSTYTFTDVAKMISTKASEEIGKDIKISNQALTKHLREEGILSKNKSSSGYSNLPNKDYEEYFDVVSRNIKEDFSKTQTRVKSNGVEFIYDRLLENKMFIQ